MAPRIHYNTVSLVCQYIQLNFVTAALAVFFCAENAKILVFLWKSEQRASFSFVEKCYIMGKEVERTSYFLTGGKEMDYVEWTVEGKVLKLPSEVMELTEEEKQTLLFFLRQLLRCSEP